MTQSYLPEKSLRLLSPRTHVFPQSRTGKPKKDTKEEEALTQNKRHILAHYSNRFTFPSPSTIHLHVKHERVPLSAACQVSGLLTGDGASDAKAVLAGIFNRLSYSKVLQDIAPRWLAPALNGAHGGWFWSVVKTKDANRQGEARARRKYQVRWARSETRCCVL